MHEFLAWVTVRYFALREEDGQTAVEYALVIGLVAIVLAVALAAGGTGIFTGLWTKVRNAINGTT